MLSYIHQFRSAIEAAGLIAPEHIEANGKLHRFSSNGKRGDDSGWYSLHQDGVPAGSFGCWRAGISETWRADIGRSLTDEEKAAHRQRVKVIRLERKAEETERKKKAKANAATIWQKGKTKRDDHAYEILKGIKLIGARSHNNALLIPMRADGELQSLQFILPNGDKFFLTGGRTGGCYFSMGNLKDATVLCIAEGVATGATIHAATGYPVAVAFTAGNLLAVSQVMREKFPELKLIVCADDDYMTEGNPGLSKANEAAKAVGAAVAIPDFGSNRPDKTSDFNDMAALFGLESVKRAIANATSPARGAQPVRGDSAWPEPQPMTAKIAPLDYPLDALPETIRAAVEEVAGYVKAPIPLVASSAIAALSLATQAHIDIRRDEVLTGPVSLFVLTIAESGERKSQADKMFSAPIQEYQDQQAEIFKPILKDYKAEMDAWEAKRGGIKEKIRVLAKEGKPTQEYENILRELEHEEPESPRVPKLMREEGTPEGLAKRLQNDWPSAGVVSNEAGIVFGGHGMSKDSVSRNLSLLNKLWDGGRYQSDRADDERSRDVRGARLTMGLMIQEPTLRAFFDQSKGLARGTGFLARFLIAWPTSRMGTRFYTPPVAGSPALSEFNRRITQILNQPVPMGEDGALTPAMLSMTTEAQAAWIGLHDSIEAELINGGELFEVKDVASKTADNAVRLAALFQMFEHGGGGAVGLDCFEAASRIALWHLSESRRFFGELALPVELANAARLDGWLIEYCKRERTDVVGKRYAQQYGPLRQKDNLDSAIGELASMDRVQVQRNGKRIFLKVNPALTEFATATFATPATNCGVNQ